MGTNPYEQGSLILKWMTPSTTLLLLLLMSTSMIIIDQISFAQPQKDIPTTNGLIDNVNLTETLVEEARDVMQTLPKLQDRLQTRQERLYKQLQTRQRKQYSVL
jgi:hypothetical protein